MSVKQSSAADFLDERITDCFEATGGYVFEREGGAEEMYWANPPQGISEFDADMYFHYKLDKPQHLLLRTVRRLLLWPLLKRQVAFNHSVRHTLGRLWYERSEMRRELTETQSRLAELEKKVAMFSGKP